MSKFNITELEVCTMCIHLLANGEYDDGTNAVVIVADGIRRTWGANVSHLVPGSSDLGFSWSSCDGCGSTLGGNRHEASALIPLEVIDS